jgi:hypothetical protein
MSGFSGIPNEFDCLSRRCGLTQAGCFPAGRYNCAALGPSERDVAQPALTEVAALAGRSSVMASRYQHLIDSNAVMLLSRSDCYGTSATTCGMMSRTANQA